MKLLILILISSFPIVALSQNTKGTTFEVDNVTPNISQLPQTAFNTIIQNKLRKEVFSLPAKHKDLQVAPSRLNGFVETIHVAFDEHRPLVISPDDVWLTICQAFGNHIAYTQDQEGNHLVSAGAPNTITVFIEDLAQENQKGWEQLVHGFNDSLVIHLNNSAVALVNQKFSTTTPIITTAYQITLMDAVKSHFSYIGESGCGIPSITLLGTTQDWQQIYDRLDGFNEYGMEFWTRELKPVIKEFVNASEGNPNVEFWQSIYKHEVFYGTTSVTGWIHKFFPYLKSSKNMEPDVQEWREVEFKKTYRLNPYIKGNSHLLSTESTFDFPKGFVNVPFVWKEQHQTTGKIIEHKLKLNAGFLAINQHENGSLQPFISWCITKDNDEITDIIRWDWNASPDTTIKHNQFYWSPGITKEPKELPVFDPENNSDFESSIESFKKLLQNEGFESNGASKVSIIVTIDGGVILESISGPLEHEKADITSYLETYPYHWQPAIGPIYPFDVNEKSAPANYKFELQL